MNSVLDLRNAVEPPHNDTRASAKFTLPSLPYPSNALADHGMSQETLELHHGKHHQAYVTALNGLVEKNDALKGKSLEELIKLSNGNSALQPVFNNAGQHWNHSTFWLSLSPQGGRIPGALGQFGSGWVWLVLDRGGRLQVVKTGNAGTPIATGEGKVLLVLDVWEHAYYVDFRNRRPDFTDNFLNQLANYEYAAAELGKA
jgi:Fe-Mn family superoxide dismutase